METITISIGIERLKEVIETNIDSILKSDYSNPVRRAIEEALKEQDGPIKKIVTEIISDAVTNPDFKERISAAVITRMVESALKK